MPDGPFLDTINQELHARPYVSLKGPAHVLHLSFVRTPEAIDAPDALVAALRMRTTYRTARHGIHAADLPGVGHLVLAWACHTSYTAVTLYLYGLKSTVQAAGPFGFDLFSVLPPGWLAARRGNLLNATRVSVIAEDEDTPSFVRLAGIFDPNLLTASAIMGDAGTVWSDFRLTEDGCNRLLLITRKMSRHEIGRTLQRLLSVEDYYHMVLLPLPSARAAQTRLTEAESRLTEVMQAISQAEALGEKRLRLVDLMALAVEIEHELAVQNVRFSPAFSYFALLKSSFEELREGKVAGVLPISVFVMRRVNPAVQTYTSLQARLEAMSQRVARAADLLRTAIELNLGEQNQRLLTRLDDRARLQLRLQETVEGLSVIAISYYAVGLLGYGFKGLKAMGWPLEPDTAIAWTLPLVVGGVWYSGQLLRRRLPR